MVQKSDFFWWRLELKVFPELEDSLFWKLENIGIKSFALECSPHNPNNQCLVIWLPSYEWSVQDRSILESSLILPPLSNLLSSIIFA